MNPPSALVKRACTICGIALHAVSHGRRPTCGGPASEHAFRVRAWRTPHLRLCVLCGASIANRPPVSAITRGTAGEVCADPRCQSDHAARQEQERRSAETIAQHRQERDAVLSRFEAELRAEHGEAIPVDVRPADLPACDRPLTPLPPARRAALEAKLRELVATALPAPAGAEASEPSTDVTGEAFEGIVRSGCELCRGSCCTNGGEHAYLSDKTLQRYAGAHPGISPEQVVAGYLAHVEPVTTEGSCVYHASAGCSLPRELRSDTCNHFLCTGMRNLVSSLRRERPATVLALCISKGKPSPIRAALLDERGITMLRDDASSAAPVHYRK